jgi:hypothetical protein
MDWAANHSDFVLLLSINAGQHYSLEKHSGRYRLLFWISVHCCFSLVWDRIVLRYSLSEWQASLLPRDLVRIAGLN